MRIKIKIEESIESKLSINESKYVFRLICSSIGVSWHFTNENNVDIYYGNNNDTEAGLKISKLENRDVLKSPKIINEDSIYFFEFIFNKSHKKILSNSKIDNDIIYTIFYLITGKTDIDISRDRWDRHNIKESILYNNDLLHFPIIDQYFQLIKEKLSPIFKFIPKWPNDAKIALALSHDTDYPEMIRWIETLRYIYQSKKINKIFHILSKKETFWKFNDWIELETKYGFKSSFYFCSFMGSIVRYIFLYRLTLFIISKNQFIRSYLKKYLLKVLRLVFIAVTMLINQLKILKKKKRFRTSIRI